MAEPALSPAEEAHRRIRTDIIESHIRPNIHLVANGLATQLEIAYPAREAFQLLASEGLVVATGRVFVVPEHSVGKYGTSTRSVLLSGRWPHA